MLGVQPFGLRCKVGKRSDYARMPADLYETPLDAIEPVLSHLPRRFTYASPCVGPGKLVAGMTDLRPSTECVWQSDLKAKRGRPKLDARVLSERHVTGADFILENPPWTREWLHVMILRFAFLRPTWLIFDADWAHTKQANFFMPICKKIVSVGRVKWMAGSNDTGKDNAAWYHFDATDRTQNRGPEFVGRN